MLLIHSVNAVIYYNIHGIVVTQYTVVHSTQYAVHNKQYTVSHNIQKKNVTSLKLELFAVRKTHKKFPFTIKYNL